MKTTCRLIRAFALYFMLYSLTGVGISLLLDLTYFHTSSWDDYICYPLLFGGIMALYEVWILKNNS